MVTVNGPEATSPTRARDRVRAALVAEIMHTAREHLARDAGSGLSLRAVARDVGMVSSAIYRYFPSRDDLLTALILDAYAAMSNAVETAEQMVRRVDYLGRWMAATTAIRQWALDHPHEYSLIFGSPIPNYQAPQDTIVQAARVPLVLVQILRDALAAGRIRLDAHQQKTAGPSLDHVIDLYPGVPLAMLRRGVAAWSAVFGLVSFELFGHFTKVVDDPADFFRFETERLAIEVVGLTRKRTQPQR